jgi:Na+-driven multidrug efflux pump
VISYNFGKKDFDQVRLLFRTSLKAVLAGSVLVLAASLLLSDAIVALFASGDAVLSDLARHGILLFSISYLFFGLNTFAATLFSSLSNGGLSAMMASLHTFVFLTGAMLILPRLGLGADGVWLGVPVAEFCSLFLSLYLLKKKQPEYGY